MTITYLLNAPDTSNSDCTPAAEYNRKMDEASQTSQALSASIASEGDEISHAFTTVSGDPNDGDWPAASGGDPYFCSFDVTTIGVDVTCGLLTLGGAAGGFHRVNSSCTSQENVAQGQTAFSGTGVKDATNTSWNPSSGAASDRFQVRIAAANVHIHNAETFEITTNSSSDAGGPWSTGTDASDNQAAFIKGRDTALDNQPAFMQGVDTTLDNQPAFMQGVDTTLDNQPAFISGPIPDTGAAVYEILFESWIYVIPFDDLSYPISFEDWIYVVPKETPEE